LSDLELLAATLGHGSPRKAGRLLRQFGSVTALARAGIAELADEGLPPARAFRLQAALELGRRSVSEPLARGLQLVNAVAVERCLRAKLVCAEQEELHVLGLDTHQRLLVHFIAAVGTVDEVQVSPRDVFRPLVRENARGVIVVHNHPTGEPLPSGSDRALTHRLEAAGDLVGVELVDHVIVARRGYYSFASERLPRR
jgi:DNA repair protein RadC